MWKEFKEFAVRGNVVDMAVGIIIGGAFGRIVQSLVNDIVLPPISLLFGPVDFSQLYINLTAQDFESLADAQAAGAAVISWGQFVTAVLQFLIVAFTVFLLIRQVNRLRRPEAAAAATPDMKACPYCISNIPLLATRCPQCTAELRPSA